MKTRRKGRSNRRSELSQSLFGSAGWLFADLMVALAMLFLVANTVGFITPSKPKPPRSRIVHTPHHSPQGLDPNYLSFRVAVTPESVQAAGTAAIAQLLSGVNHQLAIHNASGREVGFVIVLAAGPDDPVGQNQAIQTANNIVTVLRKQDRPAFAPSAGIGYWGGASPDDFQFHVFFLY
jgi:hypothetical protein